MIRPSTGATAPAAAAARETTAPDAAAPATGGSAASSVDGRALLRGLLVPLVTPMSRPGVPSAADAEPLLAALAGAGVRGLLLLGSNGEGPLLPPSPRLGEFVAGVRARWRALTGGGPVLANVTGAGTAEALARAEAVLPGRPDALVLGPPYYFPHREDEVLAHYAALAGIGAPVVAYNAPRYGTPLTPRLLDGLVALEHVVGAKDSSGDPGLLAHLVAAARRRDDFGVSQGAERQLLHALGAGVDGLVPGVANLAPALPAALLAAHARRDRAAAEAAQRAIDGVLALHTVRHGVPAVKALLADRGRCPPHLAAPLAPCTDAERRRLHALLAPHQDALVPPVSPTAPVPRPAGRGGPAG